MNPEEYDNLQRLEKSHWYYRGKRRLIRTELQRTGVLKPDSLMVDCGAGTGLFALEMRDYCRILAMDDHEESLAILRGRFKEKELLKGRCEDIPLESGSVQALTALDVLEHLPDAAVAVQEFKRVLQPGGVVAVTVPALMCLWSDWDVSLHHYRRYHRDELLSLFPEKDWDLQKINYINTAVFPAVFLLRRVEFLRGKKNRAEDAKLPRWLDDLLEKMFVEPALAGVPFPFGVGLMLVARKRRDPGAERPKPGSF